MSECLVAGVAYPTKRYQFFTHDRRHSLVGLRCPLCANNAHQSLAAERPHILFGDKSSQTPLTSSATRNKTNILLGQACAGSSLLCGS